jgi:hypothetical protein
MFAHGLPIYVALEPVDMRLGYERLGASCKNGKEYALEIVVRENDWTILHFLFK